MFGTKEDFSGVGSKRDVDHLIARNNSPTKIQVPRVFIKCSYESGWTLRPSSTETGAPSCTLTSPGESLTSQSLRPCLRSRKLELSAR